MKIYTWAYWKRTQSDMKETKQTITLTNKKTSQNQSLQQKYFHSDYFFASPYSKIRGTILKMKKGETQTNGPKDKNIDDSDQVIIHERLQRQTICIKKRRSKRHACIEYCVDTLLNGHSVCIEMGKEIMTLAFYYSIDNTRTYTEKKKKKLCIYI